MFIKVLNINKFVMILNKGGLLALRNSLGAYTKVISAEELFEINKFSSDPFLSFETLSSCKKQ